MTAASGQAQHRLRAPVALGALATSLFAAAPAAAQQQCGVAGTNGAVTCTAAGNPYRGGIVYAQPGSLSLTAQAGLFSNGLLSVTSTAGGIAVNNAGTFENGTLLTSGGAGGVTVTNGGVFGLAGNTAAAVTGTSGLRAVATAGNVVVSGSGSYASGITNSAAISVSTSGTATLTLGNVTATAGTSDGVFVTATGGSTVVLNGATNAIGGSAVRIGGGTATITNAGTLTGGIVLAGGNDTFNNRGVFQANRDSDFGAGTDTLNNSGFFRVRPAGGPTTAVTLTNLETFNNSGTVALINNRTGDRLVVPGAFVGSGASRVQLDIGASFLGAADVLQTGVASGSTIVQLFTPNGAAFTPAFGAGPVVVQAAAGTAANAFVLSSAQTGGGLVAYQLAYNPTAFTFSVVGVPTAAVYRLGRVAEGQRALWYRATDSWAAHVAASRDALAAGTGGGRLWGSIDGSEHARRGAIGATAFGVDQSVSATYRQDAFQGILGLDLLAPTADGGFSFGVMGGYTSSKLRFVAAPLDRTSYQVATGAAYAGFKAGPLFVNVTGRYQHSWNYLRSSAGFTTPHIDADLYGGAAEAGIRFGGGGFFVEPLGSIEYVHVNLQNFAAAGATVDFDERDGLRGKAGARLGKTMPLPAGTLTIYATGQAVHEFEGRDGVTVATGATAVAFRADRPDTYAHGKLGFSVAGSGGVAGFIEGFGDYGHEYRGGGGRAGLAIKL